MHTKNMVIQCFRDSKAHYKQDKHRTGIRCRLCIEHATTNPTMPLPEMRSEADIRAEGALITP
jgi:hypothetical protein